MVKVLFVCLGNICRSPAAEAVLQKMLEDEGLADEVHVASAGTSGYHDGELPDPRMRQHGSKRNYTLDSISQKFLPKHFEEYDVIITMDHSNYRNVTIQADNDQQKAKVKPLSHYCCEYSITEVPDPYFGGEEGFEYVFDLLEDACTEIVRRIKSKEALY